MELRTATTADETPSVLQYRQGQPPSQPDAQPQPANGCFVEQTGGNTGLKPSVIAGYRNPRFGMGCDFLSQGIVHTTGFYRPGLGLAGDNFQTSNNVQDDIQRALEKERIREEIIASEIARRRILEAEVRAELRMERELAIRLREGKAFDKISNPMDTGMQLEPRGIPFVQESTTGLPLEERIAIYAEERLRMRARCEAQGFEMVPFLPTRTINPRVEQAAPSHSESGQQKEKIVFLAKPGADLSGMKRKAVTPVDMSASQLFSTGNAKNNGTWSCDICQVCTTSERGLNEHIQGKKHKIKEAAVKAKKNFNIGLGVLPNKKLKPAIKVTDLNQELKVGGEVTQPLAANDRSILRKDARNKKQKKEKPKEKNNFLFWCDTCQVGAKNEKVMEDHRKGKKHVRSLQKTTENSQPIPIPQNMASQEEIGAIEATTEAKQAVELDDRTTKEEAVESDDKMEDCKTAERVIGTMNS